MLVYYFVPFIVSNRYLLFRDSNGHNSVTVQNRTHVYMNFFDHKDLGNHLLQLCPKVVKHPVCTGQRAVSVTSRTQCCKCCEFNWIWKITEFLVERVHWTAYTCSNITCKQRCWNFVVTQQPLHGTNTVVREGKGSKQQKWGVKEIIETEEGTAGNIDVVNIIMIQAFRAMMKIINMDNAGVRWWDRCQTDT